ncbi:MAG: hypothetical protein GXP62_00095 [Oligoflexia bacterium]|nr:hypothetical protein [Oligoflexia bacterium]
MPACRRAAVLLADDLLLTALPADSQAGFSSDQAPTWYAPDLPLEPVHIDIQARLYFDQRALDGIVRTDLRATRDGAATVVLDGVNLDIHEVEDIDGEPLVWRYDGKHLTVTWTHACAAGEQRRLVVRYRVQDPLTGLKFGPPDGPPWAGTDHETERARYWLPCVDHPSVRPTVAVHLRGPAAYTYLSAGALVAEDSHDDGTKTLSWRLDHPCPSYLLCFFAGQLVQAEGGEHDGKPVRFYAPPPFSAADLKRTFGRTTEFLGWITAKLGRPLPWPKYYQFAAPGIGGAMENISLVSWDDAWVMDPRLHQELGWLVDLINVHEMSHTWFGDSVVCRDFAHSWLKESWATYIESVWIEDTWGQEAMRAWLHIELRWYLSEAGKRYQRPIVTRRFDSSWDLFDAHLYPGGAVRLHLLRRTVGDEVFWKAVNAYLSRNQGRVVETDTLRLVMEEFSGRSLARFFDQWFLQPGYPKLQVTTAWDETRKRLTITVLQAQVDAKAGIGCFDVDLAVAVELGPAADATASSWQRVIVPLKDPRHVVTVSLPSAPLQVVIDPDSDLPHDLTVFDPGDDMLVRSLSACPHVRGRVRAAEAACRHGRPVLFKALGQAYRSEQSWIVRRLYAQSLGEASHASAAALLAELLALETDPKVMATLAEACGKHRDPRVAAALVAWLDQPERPWSATQCALASLGAQRGTAHIDRLTKALATESWWDRVRQGALTGLGATRSTAALEQILPWLSQGSMPVRVAAISALADVVGWSEGPVRRRVAEQLTDRLQDPEYRVRVAAGRALAALGDAQAADAVQASAASLATQDVPAIRRLAAGLRKSGQQPKALNKRVEKLEAKLAKLAERLDQVQAECQSDRQPNDA